MSIRPPNPSAMMDLAASIRANGGDPALAVRLDEEAARLMLTGAARLAADRQPAPTLATDPPYRSLIEAWHAPGWPDRLQISSLHRLAVECGVEPLVVSPELPQNDRGSVRRRLAFGEWLRAHPIRRAHRGGCLWYDRPAL